MIENSQFNYKSSPYYRLRNYTVHPLTEQGFGEYISKQSHVHKFIAIKKDVDLIDNYLNTTNDQFKTMKEEKKLVGFNI